jgi:hypothetical protein
MPEEAGSNNLISYTGLKRNELSWSSNPIRYSGLNRKRLF